MKHNDMEKKNNRGGARPGAGRRAPAPGQKKVALVLSVTIQAQEEARDLRRAGVNLNAEIEGFIRERWKYFEFPK